MRRATEVLIQKGRARVVEQSDHFYLRIEVFTALQHEVQYLLDYFGGQATRQSDYTMRWAVQGVEALTRVGGELLNVAHPLGFELLNLVACTPPERNARLAALYQEWHEQPRELHFW